MVVAGGVAGGWGGVAALVGVRLDVLRVWLRCRVAAGWLVVLLIVCVESVSVGVGC